MVGVVSSHAGGHHVIEQPSPQCAYSYFMVEEVLAYYSPQEANLWPCTCQVRIEFSKIHGPI